LLFLLKEIIFNLSERFLLMLLDVFDLLSNVSLADLKLLVLVLKINESHSNPVYTSIGSLAELLVFGDLF